MADEVPDVSIYINTSSGEDDSEQMESLEVTLHMKEPNEL